MRSHQALRTWPVLGRTILAALLPICAIAGAAAQDLKPVHYTCVNGTKLQATFSPPGASMGSVKLVYAGSSNQTTLPQALSADGGRYTQGDVEFWIKGKGATLTRGGRSTTCAADV
ncbi:MAG: MliC family protein [Microvirga sp.]